MRETADEWLSPFKSKKDRKRSKAEREERFSHTTAEFDSLLPSKEETDTLVSIYLDEFEQLHRIVHIPTFRREYSHFWGPDKVRTPAYTVLVLSMLAVSSSVHRSPKARLDQSQSSAHHSRSVAWIKACEAWLENQSQKHRRLAFYQIACMIHLAKRVNMIKKKRFWKGAAGLIQDAIAVGLHREPSTIGGKISPFNQEMRRRIWATMVSFDLQASFDRGLPTLLTSLHMDANLPKNIEDDSFDEESKEIPESKPTSEYTFTSYNHLSRRSLALRLELSRVFLNGVAEDIDYDKVIRLTHEINHEIDSLPSWDIDRTREEGDIRKPLLAYTLLHLQLRQYILPLHQPFLRLRKSNSRYQYSEIVYYNAARDMVLLNDKLFQQGIRTLNFLREDNITLSINLCGVTLLQPRGSTNMIMINSQHTLQLMEKCLEMKEDRILRDGTDEQRGYSIMCATIGLLEGHLGLKTDEAAKAGAAERFINFHLKLIGQEPQMSREQSDLTRLLAGDPIPPSSGQMVQAERFLRSKVCIRMNLLGDMRAVADTLCSL
jgi:hypothetical protein